MRPLAKALPPQTFCIPSYHTNHGTTQQRHPSNIKHTRNSHHLSRNSSNFSRNVEHVCNRAVAALTLQRQNRRRSSDHHAGAPRRPQPHTPCARGSSHRYRQRTWEEHGRRWRSCCHQSARSNPIPNHTISTTFGSSLAIGNNIPDIRTQKYDRQHNQRAIGSGGMITRLALGEPGQFEVPNVADVSHGGRVLPFVLLPPPLCGCCRPSPRFRF